MTIMQRPNRDTLIKKTVGGEPDVSSLKSKLLTTTVIPMIVGVGIAAGGAIMLADISFAAAPTNNRQALPAAKPRPGAVQVAACSAKKACNPCAAKKACNPCAAKGCNPCAAKKACNPCAAKGCNPCAAKNACNPCAAKGCNPCSAGACNPCAAGGAVSAKCMVPRLIKAALANPCAAKNACNPCAAKGCNPCAAKKACNPCAAKKACNPCAAKKACNPCAAKKACNPCAAKNACNPCAAKKACNPCAAKGCNPCAAKGCNPCNPCAAAAEVKLSNAEAVAAYDCLKAELNAGYKKSGVKTAAWYSGWKSFNTVPYPSATHGGRYVNNYANAVAEPAYGKYEDLTAMPVGSILGKNSFVVRPDGKTAAGPLFIMEKMYKGFSKDTNNWKYSMVMPTGAVMGTTGGAGGENLAFCHDCHVAMAQEADHMFFLPEDLRK